MDIVDAQIHIGPGGIDRALAAMDAIGVRAAVIDEYWLRNFNNEPHHVLPGGGYRPVGPTAELAAQLHPDRFSYLLRIHRQGVSILLVEQNAQLALTLSSRAYVLASGRVELAGESHGLLHDDHVRATYLGI